MPERFVLNRSASMLEKGGFWVIYLNFNFTFFQGEAARLWTLVLASFSENKALVGVPDDFVDFLLKKKILAKEKNHD
ncbi:MAG: hypothetical protein WC244_00145 [Patescibacteria group bacterium]|jgi:hypothetical protein